MINQHGDSPLITSWGFQLIILITSQIFDIYYLYLTVFFPYFSVVDCSVWYERESGAGVIWPATAGWHGSGEALQRSYGRTHWRGGQRSDRSGLQENTGTCHWETRSGGNGRNNQQLDTTLSWKTVVPHALLGFIALNRVEFSRHYNSPQSHARDARTYWPAEWVPQGSVLGHIFL